MKRFAKYAALALGVLVLIAAGAATYLLVRKPAQRPAPVVQIDPTPERLARGEYLVNHVSICFDCHSKRDPGFGLPFDPQSHGAHGWVWDEKDGFPGTVAASNITPDPETGIGKWTDGEVLRAMREGVDRDGNALFPIMPYGHFRQMSDDDAKAVVAYIRTLRPVRYEPPAKKLQPPLNIVEKFIPAPLEGAVSAPDRADSRAYGKYLVTIGGCSDCHTPKDDKDQPIAGMDFAGGYVMHGPGFTVTAANITPHPHNWMAQVTKEGFIERFRVHGAQVRGEVPAPQGINTLMPWLSYSGMSDEDLGAIYDYLQTVPPIENRIMPFAAQISSPPAHASK